MSKLATSRAPIAIALAACIGAVMWWKVPPAIAPITVAAWIAAAVVGAIALIPPINREICRAFDHIRDPSVSTRARVAFAMAIISICYLVFTARRQDRDFFPKTLDDQSYVIQMRMLAQGRLWMPEHPCADSFDTFHVLVRPKYASAYFPGTALLYVPLIWLSAPIWIGPVIVAGACAGLFYRVVTELADGIAGAIAAILLLTDNWFRTYSILVYGQTVALMLGMLLVWAWLRWREKQAKKWSLLIGIFGGLLAITRPADLICYGVPIGIAVMAHLVARAPRPRPSRERKRGGEAPPPRARTIALMIVGAVPLLSLQAIQNFGITGHLTQTPFSLYLDRDQPGANFGFHPYNPDAKPASVVPQKQVYYQQFILPFIQKHTLAQIPSWFKEHLPQIVDVTLPARMMLLFLPIGLLSLSRNPRRWAVVMTFPIFLLLYICYPPFVEHYALPFAPAVILCVAMGPGVLREHLGRVGRLIYPSSVLVIVVVAISMLPEFNPKVFDETFQSPMMRVLHNTIDNSDLAPAVILFRYHPELGQTGDNSFKVDPVYNCDVAWPDDAPIIRANDLGSRNIEIIRYYAERDPARTFYLFDRGNLADPMHRLGTARELAK